ncbi:Rho GTPase activation protein [Obelidium mucronatum]|nr:Rho GTPase activation protein [Obelidium mucronatum]
MNTKHLLSAKTSIKRPHQQKEKLSAPSHAISTTESQLSIEKAHQQYLGNSYDIDGPIFKSDSPRIQSNKTESMPRPKRPSTSRKQALTTVTPLFIKPNLAPRAGVLFGTTIEKASRIAGKNGIPNIIIQCIEYLENFNLIWGMDLYRVVGSTERIKEACQAFEASCSVNPNTATVSSSRGSAAIGIARSSTTTMHPKLLAGGGPRNSDSSGTASATSMIGRSGSNTSPLQESICYSSATNDGVGLWDYDILDDATTPGFSITFKDVEAAVVTGVLTAFLAKVEDGFIPLGFWNEFDFIIDAQYTGNIDPPTEDNVHQIRKFLTDKLPSQHHLHTFAYVFLHLGRVAEYSDLNSMTPDDLAYCIFSTSKESCIFLIMYAEEVFGDDDLVGRGTVSSLPRQTDHGIGDSKDQLDAIDNSSLAKSPVDKWLNDRHKYGNEHFLEVQYN